VDNTPVLYGKHLLINSVGGDLHFINKEDGQTTVKIPLSLSRPLIPVYHHDDHADLLGITSSGKMVRLDSMGKILKEKSLTSDALMSHVLWKDRWVMASSTGHIYVLDPDDFDVKETFYLGHHYSTVFGEMVTQGNYLAIYTSRNRLYVYQRPAL
jgi:outer membrane protein assembly factor BamB